MSKMKRKIVDSSPPSKWIDAEHFERDGRVYHISDNCRATCVECGAEITGVGGVVKHKLYCLKHYKELRRGK